jgi:hypothetical protein
MILNVSELTIRLPWKLGATSPVEPCGRLGFAGPFGANVSQ